MSNDDGNAGEPEVAPAPADGVRKAPGKLRGEISLTQRLACGAACIVVLLVIWSVATYGEREFRFLSPSIMPSPWETWAEVGPIIGEQKLDINTLVSLQRVLLGFGLAVIVGVPLGILCGCFPRVGAFLAPVTLFGRNIPMAALIPLTFMFFGMGESQKVMFIFIASVAFIVSDAAQAVRDISARFVDTAYTLGASRWQTVLKVLVPLAMPTIFNSLRLLFGLAFGYIMLAEVVKSNDPSMLMDDTSIGGLGQIINVARRRGPVAHIYIVLMLIPIVALALDRVLFWIQRQLFPYQYGGSGILARALKPIVQIWNSMFDGMGSPSVEANYQEVLASLQKQRGGDAHE